MAGAKRDEACIFCKIVAGQIPSLKVFENERVLAFLDIEPLARGHTLIIPKEHYARVDEMPPEVAGACLAAAPAIARAVMREAGAGAWQLLQNNGKAAQQAVGHVHFHIIPRREGDGLGYRWNPTKLDMNAGKQLAEQIRAAVGAG